jgi:hypothetical protein
VAKSAVLSVKVLVDAAQAANELNQVGDEAEGMGSKLSKIGGAVAAAGIVAFAATAVSAASDLEQAMGGVDAVFKDNAKQIHAWASDTSDNIRLPAADFERFALQIGAQLKNAGVPMDQLAGKTKDILGLASDLSAQFGGSTAEAVDTLSGALKGNIETLDNYGVSISAASVSAKAQAMGLDQSTEAAKASAKQQATLAIIFEQTADAQGAAGREADSFGAQQEHLNEVMTNFLAAVGGPLLSGLSSLLESLTGLAPVITPVAAAIADLVGWVLELPAPLLIAAAALVAWQVVGGLAGITTAFAAAVRTLTAAFKGLQTGTIVGAVLTGVFVAMTALQGVFSDTDEEIAGTTETYDRWISTLNKGKVTDLTRDTIAFDSAASGLLKTYEALGISTEAYLDASTGVEGGQEALAGSVQQATNRLFQQGGVFEDVSGAIAGAVVKQEDFVKAVAAGDLSEITGKVQKYADEQSRLTGTAETGAKIMDDYFAAIEAGKDPTSVIANVMGLADQTAGKFGVSADQAAEAARALGEDAGAAVDPVEALKQSLDDAKAAAEATVVNQAMTSMKTTAEDAQRAVDFLSLTLDKMTGGTRSLEAAQAGLNSSLSGIAGAFKAVEGEASLNQDALVAWDVQALTTNEAGQKAYDALVQVRSGFEETVGAAYAASAAAGDNTAAQAAAQQQAQYAYDAFIAQADAMGISGEQAATLAGNLGILNAQQLDPKVFQLIAQDEEARAKVAALQAQGIDPKDIVVTATTDPATGAIHQVITVAESATATIPVEAVTPPAAAEIQQTADASYPATIDAGADVAAAASTIKGTAGEPYKATVTTGANVAPAQSAIDGFVGQARNITIQVFANTSPANITISALVNEDRTKTVAVAANTSSFDASMRSITNASYSAVVTVTANTSAATAAIAAVPRVAGLAAPAAPAAAVAPTLRGTTKAAAAPAVTWNIKVDAGINDPDSVAKAINRVVLREQRRSGTVFAR